MTGHSFDFVLAYRFTAFRLQKVGLPEKQLR